MFSKFLRQYFVFYKVMYLEPGKATVVTTIAYLHNIIRLSSVFTNIYTAPGTFAHKDSDRNIRPLN